MRHLGLAACLGCAVVSVGAQVGAQAAATFEDAEPGGGQDSAETGPVDSDGRQLRPYVRPPYDSEAENEERRSRSTTRRQSGHRHDGFYFRLAVGIGGGTDALSGSLDGYGFAKNHGRSGRMRAFAVPSEVAVGYTVLPGLVTGAGIYNSVWPAPRANAESPVDDYEFDTTQLTLFAATVDYYVLPKQGWHLQVAPGIASFNMGFGTPGVAPPLPAQAHVAIGGGFMIGAGREWFVAEQWSVGAMGRVMAAWTRGDDDDGGSWSHRTGTLGALMTVTYH